MEYVVIARDGTDAEAEVRRAACRPAHLAGAKDLRAAGHLVHGGAILDAQGRMVGSVLIVDFPDRPSLDGWLENDPYVTGGVWRDIEVHPFRTAPV